MSYSDGLSLFRVYLGHVVVLCGWKVLLLTVSELCGHLRNQRVVLKRLSRLHDADDCRLHLSILLLSVKLTLGCRCAGGSGLQQDYCTVARDVPAASGRRRPLTLFSVPPLACPLLPSLF